MKVSNSSSIATVSLYLSFRKLPDDFKFLFNNKQPLSNAAFIPVMRFSISLSLFLGSFFAVPLMYEYSSTLFPKEIDAGPYLGFFLMILSFLFALSMFRLIKKRLNAGKIRYGIFLLPNYMVIRDGNGYHIFPQKHMIEVIVAYGSTSKGTTYKNLGFKYYDQNNEENLYFFPDDNYGIKKRQAIIDFVNHWIATGEFKKGVITGLPEGWL
jgi:hypothetical protein